MVVKRELNMEDILGILRRRMWWILVPTVLCPAIAFLVALKLPAKYQSQALVLVEQQKVPDKFVTPVVTEQLNMRLVTMQEQILSRTRLQPIIERLGLYKDELGKKPMEELVDRVRRSIAVSPIRAEGASGLPGFHIAFTADDPRLAQMVCQEIMGMFILENLKAREVRAQGATDFLTNQLDDAKRKLDEHDAKLAEFKKKYLGQLPSDESRNLQILTTLNGQLDAVNQQLNAASQQKMLQEALLAQRQGAQRAGQSGGVESPSDVQMRLTALQSELSVLQAKYTADHPDVKKVKNQIELLKKSLQAPKTPTPEEEAQLLDTPEMGQLRIAIRASEETIRYKLKEQERLQREISRFQARIQLSPVVEEQYKQLTRDYDTALAFYNDFLKKKSDAEVATDLERKQQGEQFTVMDPPSLPERPTFPNKPLFAGGGLGIGLALGLGFAMLLEMRDKFIRTERDVEVFLQLPTLALMPNMENVVSINGKKSFWKRLRRRRGHREAVSA